MSSARCFVVGSIGFLVLALPQLSAPAYADTAPSRTASAGERGPGSDLQETGPTAEEDGDERAADERAAVERENQARALQLKDSADELFRIREYVDALELYGRAYALHPDARLLYNAGRSLQALGRYGDALQKFLDFRAEAPAELRDQLHGFDALLDDLRQRVCEVSVGVNLEGAKITLGSDTLGESPLPKARFVNAGQVRLRVQKEGYFPVEKDVVLPRGGTATYDIVLESKAKNGKLTVLSRVPGTTITVGGATLGQAPTEIVLPPGTHRILGRKKDHDDVSTQVVLEAGQQRTITLDPVAPALYERWWFWGGVGVVAAAAVITVIVATPSAPRNTDGDFSPSAISAPLIAF